MSSREYHKKKKDLERFGGNKEKALERDGYRCVGCGISEEEHKGIKGRGLYTHHVNGEGRGNSTPDNRLENLITLCGKCHYEEHRENVLKGLRERWDKCQLNQLGTENKTTII